MQIQHHEDFGLMLRFVQELIWATSQPMATFDESLDIPMERIHVFLATLVYRKLIMFHCAHHRIFIPQFLERPYSPVNKGQSHLLFSETLPPLIMKRRRFNISFAAFTAFGKQWFLSDSVPEPHSQR